MANETIQGVLMNSLPAVGVNISMTTLPPMMHPLPPEYYLTMKFVCDKILMPLIVSFGIVGNILSLAVLTRKEMTSATNTFLIALGISDMTLLVTQIPHFLSYDKALMSQPQFLSFHRHFTILRYVSTNMFLTCTCWITVAVTVERFISLRFMTHPRLACTTHRAKVAAICIFIMSFIFHLSKFFEYIPNPDLTRPEPLLHTILSKRKSYDTWVHIANITLAAIIPVFLLVVVNSFLIYFLMQHRKRMQRHRAGSTMNVDMTHVTTIVVAMVLVFILCHSFGVFLALTIAAKGRRVVFGNFFYLSLNHINTLMVTANSSVNFLLYSAISQKFRSTFAKIFLGRAQYKNSQWSYQNSPNENTLTTKPNVPSYISKLSTDSSYGKSDGQSTV